MEMLLDGTHVKGKRPGCSPGHKSWWHHAALVDLQY